MHEINETSTLQNITISANGQPRVLPAGSTIASLLASLDIQANRVVVQLDGVIIPRPDYPATTLQPGCKLEIITMVGGG
ncbi:MAG: hypothetical protein NVS2B12_21720 [Ktedonobacteraceae bacterium]